MFLFRRRALILVTCASLRKRRLVPRPPTYPARKTFRSRAHRRRLVIPPAQSRLPAFAPPSRRTRPWLHRQLRPIPPCPGRPPAHLQPGNSNNDYLNNNAQLISAPAICSNAETPRRLPPRKTPPRRALQVSDSERQLASTPRNSSSVGRIHSEFAQQDLDSFQKTVDISAIRLHAGDERRL